MRFTLTCIVAALLLGCGGGDGDGDDGEDKAPSKLPTSGEITKDKLTESAIIEDGYSKMSIDSDSELTLVLDEPMTLSASNNGLPQKLVVSGQLTITK
ncbi:hypothetical protein AB4341_08590 [Vibrio breoganii]